MGESSHRGSRTTGTGRIDWPRSLESLTDTSLCPACFTPLPSAVCLECGLDVRGRAATELLTRSGDAAAALADRARLIAQLRAEARAAEPALRVPHPLTADAAPAASPPAPPGPVASAVRSAVPEESPVRSEAPGPPAPPRATPVAPRTSRRSSVQVLLLIVGVSLVAVAGIFFLTVAWIQSGLAFRSVVVAVITLVALLVASLLRRRGLTATAEGIGALFVTLVYLDLWAARANGMLGADAPTGAVYWGAALTVSALAFLAWFRVARVRAGSVAGYSTIAIGAGLLLGGLASRDVAALPWFAGALTTLVVALVWTTTARLARWASVPGTLGVERVVLWCTAAVALLGGVGSALFLAPEHPWGPAASLGLVALATAAHGIALVRTGPGASRRAGIGALGIVGGLPALAAAAIAVRLDDGVAALWACILVPVVLALVSELLWARRSSDLPSGAWSSTWRGVGIGAAATAAISAALALIPAVVPLTTAVAAGFPPRLDASTSGVWLADAWATVAAPSTVSVTAVGSLAVAGALITAAWAVGSRLRGRRAVGLAWFAAGVLVLAVPLLAAPAPIVATALVSALVGAALLRSELVPPVLRPPVLAAIVALGTLGYCASFAEAGTWLAASVGVLVLLLLLRPIGNRRLPVRMTLLVAGVVFLVVSAGVAVTPVAVLGGPADTNGVLWSAIAAAATAVVVALPLGRFAVPREREVAGIAAIALTVALAAAGAGLGRDVSALDAALRVGAGILGVGGVGLWLLLPLDRTLELGRRTAALAAAPLLAALGAAVLFAVTASGDAVDDGLLPTVIASTAILVAAAGLVAAFRTPELRIWLDAGAAVVLLISLGLGIGVGAVALVLLLVAVAVLLFALATDGLFGSRSPRRHLGWLALAFATAALWLRLDEIDVTEVALHVLPLGIALLAIAAALWRARPSDSQRFDVAGIAFAGLTVAIAPLALVGGAASWQPITIGVVSALLVLVPLALLDELRSLAVRLGVAAAGTVGVVLTVVRQASTDAAPLWILVGFVVLAIGAFALAARGVDDAHPGLAVAAGWMLSGAIVVSAAAAMWGIAGDDRGALVASVVVSVSAAAGAAGFLRDRAPLLRVTGWVGYLVATAAALWCLAVGVADPFELVTLPLAIAALVHGGVALRRSSVGSWPALGPGLLVLLVPPLLADLGPTPLWRIVGLGLVALAVLLVGLRWRLQAPFLLGSIVLLWHAGAQLWPWIQAAYESVPWWAWLGIGGTLLIVLAARYERRLRDARAIALRIGALR